MPRPNTGPRLAIRRRPGAQPLYVIQWTHDGRSYRHGTGIPAADPDAAQAYFREWLRTRAKAERAGPGRPDQVRITDVIEDYVNEHTADVASRETLSYGARPLGYYFREDTVASMTPTRVREFWTWRRLHSIQVIDAARGLVAPVERAISDNTIIRELGGVLRPAIRHAIRQRRLVDGEYYVPVPSAPPGRSYWITRPEAARLLRETRRDIRSRLHLPLYTLIALYTGARRGAILDLTWQQIDLVHAQIDFNPPGRTRTAKGRAVIPIPRSLLAALKRAHARASCSYVIAYRGAKVAGIKTGFNSAAERAGIPDCTSHVLRHTCGTWMAQRGVSLRQIGGWLGHSEARTTELYAHHSPGHLAEARRAMERK